MRKILVLLAFALAVLAPSAAAFADGAPVGIRATAVSTGSKGDIHAGERPWFYGCFNGQAWQAYVTSAGIIKGKFVSTWECEGTWADFMD